MSEKNEQLIITAIEDGSVMKVSDQNGRDYGDVESITIEFPFEQPISISLKTVRPATPEEMAGWDDGQPDLTSAIPKPVSVRETGAEI